MQVVSMQSDLSSPRGFTQCTLVVRFLAGKHLICCRVTCAGMHRHCFSWPPDSFPTISLGSAFWTDAEKSLFNTALGTYGKEFSLIRKMVHPPAVTSPFVWVKPEQNCTIKLAYKR